MGKLSLLTSAAALSAAAVLVAGCTSNDDVDKAGPTPTRSAHPSSSAPQPRPTDRSEHIPGESVTKAPALPEGHVVAQAVNASGNQEIDVKGGLKSGPLSIMVNCQGKGKITVAVKPVGLSFPLECVTGEVSSTFNQLSLKRARTQGTVSVTAPSTVRWAITVGH